MTELWRLSIRQAADGLAGRQISSVELLQATLDRMHQTEPAVHAYVTTMERSARQEAEAADDEIARGHWRGPLHGIPIGVKDLCFTEGVATQAGSRLMQGFVPDHDSTVVARLKEAGAVLVGKTVTHEFAYGQDVPPTRNPWDLRCYPGGSSAGSGVSVAVGSAFGAIGTDTGGSIRVPAAVNGVVGLKPTFGRVSKYGVFPMSPSLDTVGPLTRTAEDCALMLGAIAGHDPRDATSLEAPVPDFTAGIGDGVRGLRLGLDRQFFFYEHVSDEVRAAAEEAINRLSSLGAEVVEVRTPQLEFAPYAGMAVLTADTSEWHRKLLRTRGGEYSPGVRVMLEVGELVQAAGYVHGERARAAIRAGVRNAFERHRLDCLIGPTLPTTTMPLADHSTNLAGEDEDASLSPFLHHCFLGNVIGIPALSFPCGFSPAGLPIGLQVYGRPLTERTLLRIAHAYEQTSDWHTRRPEPQSNLSRVS
jgi:aspartyl-tRNA(Asn)/glutamyl-tRNA(Gln) amidotransferase subunit A